MLQLLVRIGIDSIRYHHDNKGTKGFIFASDGEHDYYINRSTTEYYCS